QGVEAVPGCRRWHPPRSTRGRGVWAIPPAPGGRTTAPGAAARLPAVLGEVRPGPPGPRRDAPGRPEHSHPPPAPDAGPGAATHADPDLDPPGRQPARSFAVRQGTRQGRALTPQGVIMRIAIVVVLGAVLAGLAWMSCFTVDPTEFV